MTICYAAFALIEIVMFITTVIKFIQYIREELKGEYGEIDKSLIVASVIGLIIMSAFTAFTLYFIITTIQELSIYGGVK